MGKYLLAVIFIFFVSATNHFIDLPQINAQSVKVTFTGPGAGDQDDMTIWVHPSNLSASTIIGSDKNSFKIFVYNLSGITLQTISTPDQPGNIDVRYNFPLSGSKVDIVGVNQRAGGYKILLYQINSANSQLTQVDNGIITGANYGFCLYRSPTSGKYYGFTTSKAGNIEQYELKDAGGGKIGGTKVRNWTLAKSEGCVADDENKWVYISDERNGIWKYGAEPNDSTTGTKIASVGDSSGLSADVEGLTIYHTGNTGGYLIASSQGSNNFKVYNRLPPHSYITTFSTGTTSTDGIDVSNLNFTGTNFSKGIFVSHNGGQAATMRGVKWEDIASATSPQLVIDTSWDPRSGSDGGPFPTSTTGPTLTPILFRTPTPAQLSRTPTPTPTGINLPDLVVTQLKIELETRSGCYNNPPIHGLSAYIKNIGNADAGPFVVDVGGGKKTVTAGLASGQTAFLWGFATTSRSEPSCPYYTAMADATFLITESDENNNQLSQCVPHPTLPPVTCTPTPTISSCIKKSQGDANCDGNIDLIDYNSWKSEFTGLILSRKSDFNSDSKITLIDYEIWRRTFIGRELPPSPTFWPSEPPPPITFTPRPPISPVKTSTPTKTPTRTLTPSRSTSTPTRTPTKTRTPTPTKTRTPTPTSTPTSSPISFSCTMVIAYSQVGISPVTIAGYGEGWYVAPNHTLNFETIVDNNRWQLLWDSGHGIDKWQNPSAPGWTKWQNREFPFFDSACTTNSATPDRILLSVSGPYGSDELAWSTNIKAAINTIIQKIPSTRKVILQAVVGGPNHQTCPCTAQMQNTITGCPHGPTVRASWQHAHIDNAINMVIGDVQTGRYNPRVQIVAGFSPEVRSCSDYLDGTGHLTVDGARSVGVSIGQYYRSLN